MFIVVSVVKVQKSQINQDFYRATFLQHTMHKTYNKSLPEGQFLLIFHPDKSIK